MHGMITEPFIPSSKVVRGWWIGEGGFGDVYRGTYRGKDVALKMLMDAQDASASIRLKYELLLLWTARHNDIVLMYGFINEPQKEAIVLEYAKHGALGTFLRSLPEHPPLSITVRMVQQLTNAMEFLHQLNPVRLHLDLKADHILVDEEYNAKLSNFGLSKYQAAVKFGTSKKNSGAACFDDSGIRTHVPPKKFADRQVKPSKMDEKFADCQVKPSKMDDVYSYAITLWEILSREDASTCRTELEDCKNKITTGYMPPDASVRRDCPEELKALMKSCWDCNIEKRPTFKEIKPLLVDMTRKLDLAVSQRDHTILQKMVDLKNIPDTFLHWQVKLGSEQCFTGSHFQGHLQNSRGQHGWTPLHVAARVNAPDDITLLLSHGAIIDAQDNSLEQSPLHVAALNGNSSCVKILLLNNADYKLKDFKGCTALDLVTSKLRSSAEDMPVCYQPAEFNYFDCAVMLREADIDAPLDRATELLQISDKEVPDATACSVRLDNDDDDDDAVASNVQRISAASQGQDKMSELVCDRGGMVDKSRFRRDFSSPVNLGSGSFGMVVKVERNFDGCAFAVKMIPLKVKSISELKKKIARDVQVLSSLKNEHIVRYHFSWLEKITKQELRQHLSNTSSSKTTMSALWSSSTEDSSRVASEDRNSDGTASERPTSINRHPYIKDVVNNKGGLQPSNEPFLERQYYMLYIQMEYCENGTLRKAIDENLYKDRDRTWRFLLEIVIGIVGIHNKGAIHRDLTPVNIFLDSNDRIKIGDFGLAKMEAIVQHHLREAASQCCEAEHTAGAGTPLYTAPEVKPQGTENYARYTQQVDMYSLGLIFFEMCYHPFETVYEKQKVISALRQPDIKFPDDFNQQGQLEKQAYVMKWLLNHDPALRPRALDLKEWLLKSHDFERFASVGPRMVN